MNLSEKISFTLYAVERVLSKPKYLLLSLISMLVIFSVLYYFMVAKIADNSLRIAIMMSGASYIAGTLFSILLISILFGIYLPLVVFKINMLRAVGGSGFFGIVGGGVGAFGVGCPTCGSLLFGLIGAPLALMYLPFRGLELRILGILVLILSIYFVGKSINAKCEIKL